MIIAAYTGNRSEYGLLRPVLLALNAALSGRLVVLAGEYHHQAEHGHTVEHVRSDGLSVLSLTSDLDLAGGDSVLGQAAIMAAELAAVSGALEALRPDWLLLYGDRAETLAAACAAHYQGVPIAHLEAGDTTTGGMPDDRTRDAVTCLASLALTTNEPAARRVRERFGHRAEFVGLPSLDALRADPATQVPPDYLMPWLQDTSRPFALLAWNPAPERSGSDHAAQVRAVVDGVRHHRCRVLAMRPNGDPGSASVLAELWRSIGVTVVDPLPPSTYYGLLRALASHPAAVMVGNSSSGIKEAPAFGLATVNVGDRQRGRLTHPLTLSVPAERMAVAAAVGAALCPAHQAAVATAAAAGTAYGDGHAAERIVAALLRARPHRKPLSEGPAPLSPPSARARH